MQALRTSILQVRAEPLALRMTIFNESEELL
jgi:hypothetical protein